MGAALEFPCLAMKALRLELSVEVSPVRTDQGASAAQAFAVRLDLHPRWLSWQEATGPEVTLDFEGRRRYERDPATGEVDDVSLLADPHVRLMELPNRAHVRAVIEAGGATVPGFGPVLTEHQLSTLDRTRQTTITQQGVVTSIRSMFGMKSRFDIEVNEAGEQTRYLHDDRVLLAHARRGFEATSAFVRAFVQFVRYRFNGHPLVLERLASAGFIPASLNLSALTPLDLEGGVVSVRVTSAVEVDAELPSRDGSFVVFDAPRERVDAHIERLHAPGFRDDRPPLKERVEMAVAAARAGRVFDAFIAFVTLTLERDVVLPPALAEVLRSSEEPRTRRLLGLMRSPRDADDARAMIDAYATLRDVDGLHPEFLLTQEAVARRSLSDHAGAIACYSDALDHNPFLLGAYKDLGDCYAAAYDARRAWRCWEAARRLDPAHPMLRGVHALERRILDEQPDYFMPSGDAGPFRRGLSPGAAG